jgi:hypothetical protein
MPPNTLHWLLDNSSSGPLRHPQYDQAQDAWHQVDQTLVTQPSDVCSRRFPQPMQVRRGWPHAKPIRLLLPGLCRPMMQPKK